MLVWVSQGLTKGVHFSLLKAEGCGRQEIVSGEHFEEMTLFWTSTGLVLHDLSKTKPDVIFCRHFTILEIVMVSSVKGYRFCTLISRNPSSNLDNEFACPSYPENSGLSLPKRFLSQCLLQESWKIPVSFRLSYHLILACKVFVQFTKMFQVSGSNTAAVTLCLTWES